MPKRVPQTAENFDSTARLMLEALGKASAELEKSVTAFTEQLISFNESVQKSLDEELRHVNSRMESAIKVNLDELGHEKHVLVKRLLQAERAELESLAGAGKEVRASLCDQTLQIEQRIESFINAQINELKEFLEQPRREIESSTASANTSLEDAGRDATAEVLHRQEQLRQKLADTLAQIEATIAEETRTVKESIGGLGKSARKKLTAQVDSISADLEKTFAQAQAELEERDYDGVQALEQAEMNVKAAVRDAGKQWHEQTGAHCDQFDQLLASLSAVLNESFETKLNNAAAQARQEITVLAEQAHEKISTTRNELEVELRDLERDYVGQFEAALNRLQVVVNERANDKRNNGPARQHKAQKLRDQMHLLLNRWGAGLVDSVKDAATEFEAEFNRVTDGFHTRIEGARASAIEALERESRLMQKDLERTMKEFQKDLDELESQIGLIEKAGQDAALTVIACRKAVLSFRGE